MHGGGAITTDATEIAQQSGLSEIEIARGLSSLAMKEVISMWREDSSKHRLQVNYDFESPLFGGVR